MQKSRYFSFQLQRPRARERKIRYKLDAADTKRRGGGGPSRSEILE